MLDCLNCGTRVKPSGKQYCTNKCQLDYQYHEYIRKWQSGQVDGSRGINVKNTSKHILRYLAEKYNNSCPLCGWHEVNISTGKVPLEIDHIDGNSENNSEENLRLICPNCHSLTSNFRNLNRGSGRSWRRAKYVKVV